MRKRERLEIIHDILRSIKEKGSNVRPTHILYKSNLSHSMLKDYLGELMDKEFILEEKDKKGKINYSLTEKGFKYLGEFSVIQSFVESYGL